MLRDVGVGIILGHTDEIDVVGGVITTVEVGEIPVGEGLGDLDGAVGAKIKVDEGIAFFDLADGLVEVVDDNEGLEVLVLNVRIDAMENLEGFIKRTEVEVGLGVHHHVEATFDDAPIILVAIGDCNHAATARSDTNVGIDETFGEVFETLNEAGGREGVDITTIEDSMNADATNTVVVGMSNHFF